jgi:DoxX-like family
LKSKTIFYWVTTSLIAFELLYGADWDLTRRPDVVTVMTHLGYPFYLLTIIGVWKVLGVIALLVPRFPRLKEWAYAGAFFEKTGAVLSHVARGDHTGELVVPLAFSALTLASWALRPPERTLGALFQGGALFQSRASQAPGP